MSIQGFAPITPHNAPRYEGGLTNASPYPLVQPSINTSTRAESKDHEGNSELPHVNLSEEEQKAVATTGIVGTGLLISLFPPLTKVGLAIAGVGLAFNALSSKDSSPAQVAKEGKRSS